MRFQRCNKSCQFKIKLYKFQIGEGDDAAEMHEE